MEKHFQRLMNFGERRYCGMAEWEVVRTIKIACGLWYVKARNIRWITTIKFHLLMEDFLFCFWSQSLYTFSVALVVEHSVEKRNKSNNEWSVKQHKYPNFPIPPHSVDENCKSGKRHKSFSSTGCRLNLPPPLNHFNHTINFPGKFSPANSLARRTRKAPKDRKGTDEVRRYLMVSNGFQWLEQHFI